MIFTDNMLDTSNEHYIKVISMLPELLKVEFNKIQQNPSDAPKRKKGPEIDPNAIISVLDISMKGNRIPCPLSGCTKDFLNFDGVKYHLTKARHCLDILANSSIVEEGQQQNDFNTLRQTLKDSMELIPSNLFPLSIPWYFTMKKRSFPLKISLEFENATMGETVVSKIKRKTKDKDIVDMSLMANKITKSFPLNPPPETIPRADYIAMDFNSFGPSTVSDTKNAIEANVDLKLTGDILEPLTGKLKSNILEGFLTIHLIEEKKLVYLMNPSIDVWALDWAPGSTSNEQYLAAGGVAKFNTDRILGQREVFDLENCIQIWRVDYSKNSDPELALVINHSFGSVLDLKFCPNGAFDAEKVIYSNF